MVYFTKLKGMMAGLGLEALLTLDLRHSYYLTGYMDPETWLRDVQDLTTLLPVISFPDRSFVIGPQLDDNLFPGESYWCEMVLEKRLEMLVEQLAARRLHRSRIGLDMDYTPASVLTRLKDLLPEAEFVAADMLLYQLRAIKNADELTYIRKAVDISENAFLDIKDAMIEGTPLADIAAAWAKAVIDRGGYPVAAMPFDFVMQFPLSLQEGRGQEEPYINRVSVRLEAGITTRLDLVVCYRGYLSDHKIVICPGEPAPAAVTLYKEHWARQEFMKDFIKPGMSKGEVYDACLRNFEHLDEYAFWIHGVGLDVHEEPRIGTLFPSAVNVNQAVTFEVGQVLALEPSWLVEDLYLLNKDGFERLTNLPQQIIVC